MYSYGGGCNFGRPLRVGFSGEDPPRFPGGIVSITVCAVPSAERRSTMTALQPRLADVCDWISRAETGSPTWRMTNHELMVELREGQARIVES